MNIDDIVVSSCSLPEHDLPSILGVCREIGYRNFEVFTSWAKSSGAGASSIGFVTAAAAVDLTTDCP
jgi:hypothetical protein